MSFASLHRLLPWAAIGFGVNVITGMLFFVGIPHQYTGNKSFYWKLALVMLAGLNAVYFTVLEEPWALGPGDDAPPHCKIRRCVSHAPLGWRDVLRQHVAIFGQLILAGTREALVSLVVGTILLVSVGTVLVGIAGYVLDRCTARQERKE